MILSFVIVDFFIFKKLAQNAMFVQDRRYLISLIPFIGKVLLLNKLSKLSDQKYKLPDNSVSMDTHKNENVDPEEILEIVEKPNTNSFNAGLDNEINKPLNSN